MPCTFENDQEGGNYHVYPQNVKLTKFHCKTIQFYYYFMLCKD